MKEGERSRLEQAIPLSFFPGPGEKKWDLLIYLNDSFSPQLTVHDGGNFSAKESLQIC